MTNNIASIDIGTNTLRLLITGISENRKLKPVLIKRIITRLGGDYKEDTGISPAAKERTVTALEAFAGEIKRHEVKDVRAVATSVVRRAGNSREFLKEVSNRTGIQVDVISGDEEARLSLLGVLSVITGRYKHGLVVDIGGGSTEFIVVDNGRDMTGAWSLEMGVVHLTERYLKTDPPAIREIKDMEAGIEETLVGLRNLMRKNNIDLSCVIRGGDTVFIGTAGTITTLAAIDQGLERYTPEKINNYELSYDAIKKIYHYLASLPLKQRAEVLSLEKGREDIIIPGAAIVLKAMEIFGFEKMIVSDAGLLEGIILDKVNEQLSVSDH